MIGARVCLFEDGRIPYDDEGRVNLQGDEDLGIVPTVGYIAAFVPQQYGGIEVVVACDDGRVESAPPGNVYIDWANTEPGITDPKG